MGLKAGACNGDDAVRNAVMLYLILLWLVISAVSVIAPPAFGCYAVVVGKEASADGSVIFGHNEQNGGRRIINLRVIPRIKHKPGDVVKPGA